jgi:hypothetical protein
MYLRFASALGIFLLEVWPAASNSTLELNKVLAQVTEADSW